MWDSLWNLLGPLHVASECARELADGWSLTGGAQEGMEQWVPLPPLDGWF